MDPNEDFKIRDAESYNSVVENFDQLTENYSTYIVDTLLDRLGSSPGARLLDIGCGTGLVSLGAARHFDGKTKVTGIDLSDEMLKFARRKAEKTGLDAHTEFIKSDAEKLNLPDQSADCAVSLYAFRHFPNPAKAMQELFRVLKPGGQVIVAVGSAPKLFSVDGVRAAISAPIRMLAEKSGRRRTACGHLEAFAQLHLPDTYKDTVAPWTEHRHGFSDSIESLVTQAGFHLQSREWKGAKYKIDSIDEYWNLQATFSSVARKKISAASANDVIKLKNFFYDDCRKVQNAGGALVYEVGAAVIRAKK